MPRGIGIFSPECRTECINTAQGGSKRFRFQLTAHREVCFFTEKVLCIVDKFGSLCRIFALRSGCNADFSNLFKREGRHLKHFTGTLCITAGDKRCVDILKAAFLEKGMNRKGHLVAHPENCTECICPRPQMCVITQIFHGHFVFLQRIGVRRTFAQYGQ